MDDPIGDDVLRLIFISCHPVLSTEARAALTLRVVGGLTTDEIARAFLTPEPTIAQRIVRAKKTLAREEHSIRSAARPGPGGAALVGAGSDLPDLQRRVFSNGRRGVDSRIAVRRGVAAGPDSG